MVRHGFRVSKNSYNIEFKDFKSISIYNGEKSNSHIGIEADKKIAGQEYSNLDFYAHDIKISNCEFTGNVFGIAASSAKNVTIENCKFYGNEFVPRDHAGGYAILLQSCQDINIKDCEFVANEKSRHAIYVSVDRDKTDKINCKNIFIENCTFDAGQITKTNNTEFYSPNTAPINVRTVDVISIKKCKFKNTVCCVSLFSEDGIINDATIEDIIADGPVWNTGVSEARYLFNFLGENNKKCSIRNVYLYNVPEDYRYFSSITNAEVSISDCEIGNLKILCYKGSKLYFEDTFVEVEKDSTEKVTVIQQKATELNLNKTQITMNVGEVETLIPNINPSSTTKKKVNWESSDINIATVDENGNVTGINQGNAVITAKTTDGTNIFATCDVTINRDSQNPLVEVKYSTTSSTNEDVVVTITANEELQKIEGWQLSNDKKVLIKTYTKNDEETIMICDLAGNGVTKKIKIENIDKEKPIAQVKYNKAEQTLDGVMVTIEANEELQGVEGWQLSSNKKTLSKIYIQYSEETITVYDLVGNSTNISIEVKKLDKIEVTTNPSKTEYIEGENFNSNGMKVVAIYTDNTSKEITDYVVTDGNSLTVGKTNVTISYTESNITKTIKQEIKVSEKLKIDFEDYNETTETEKKYLENIEPKTTLGEFINKIKTNGEKQIFKGNTEITNNETKISTGMKLKISLNNEIFEYTIVIKGDTNGDGECDLKDLLQVNKHRLNKTQLEDEYFLAGDVNKDNTVDIKDLLQINKFRLGKIKSL